MLEVQELFTVGAAFVLEALDIEKRQFIGFVLGRFRDGKAYLRGHNDGADHARSQVARLASCDIIRG